MRYLIRLFGEWLARQIEKGSASGAIVGAALGLAVSSAIVVLLNKAELLEAYRYAMYIVLGVPFAICGALLGGRLGPSSAATQRSVRLTNYNRSAAPLGLALLPAAIAAVIWFAPESKKRDAEHLTNQQRAVYSVGCGVALVGLFGWSALSIWSVELGSTITVHRLLSSRQYDVRKLKNWEFVAGRQPLGRQPFSGTAELRLVFDRGRSLTIPIRGERSEDAVRALSAT